MNSEKTLTKAVRVISVVALLIGAAGCASQATGGSKLGHEETMTAINQNANTIEVCNQFGAVMQCELRDRDQVRDELEYRMGSVRYGYDR